jgi:hypothetical protein
MRSLGRQLKVETEIAGEASAADRVAQQYERGELRQVHPIVVDERGFHAAITEEQAAVELRKRCE